MRGRMFLALKMKVFIRAALTYVYLTWGETFLAYVFLIPINERP